MQASQHVCAPHMCIVLQPRIVHRDAVTDEVENITLMHCPLQRTVKIPVPVQARAPSLLILMHDPQHTASLRGASQAPRDPVQP